MILKTILSIVAGPLTSTNPEIDQDEFEKFK